MADASAWTIVIGVSSPIISAASALSATALTNARHDKRESESREYLGRKADREYIATVIVPSTKWANLQTVLVPALAKMSPKDLTEFIETDTGHQLRDLNEEMTLAFTRARLFLEDDALREKIKELSDHRDAFAEVVMDPINKSGGAFEPVLAGVRWVRAFELELRALESLAVERLYPPPSERTGVSARSRAPRIWSRSAKRK